MTTATVSVPSLARLCGLSHTAIYDRLEANTGPKTRMAGRQTSIPITEAIQWVEREAAALRRSSPTARRIRRLEDAATTLRVEWATSRIQNRFRSRRRHVVMGRKPEAAIV
jgi:predicted DNA-binding transcriptional regulator AlpA